MSTETGTKKRKRAVATGAAEPLTLGPSLPPPVHCHTPILFALNKPRNLVVTLAPRHLPQSSIDILPRRHCFAAWVSEIQLSFPPESRPTLFPIGRLDAKTEGLIICTNDGSLAHRICSPGAIPKEYVAVVLGEATQEALDSLTRGIVLQDGPARAIDAAVLAVMDVTKRRVVGGQPRVFRSKRTRVRIVVAIGRNRIVRRMLAHVGLPVVELKRTRIGGLELAGLGIKANEHLQLSGLEIDKLTSVECKDTKGGTSEQE